MCYQAPSFDILRKWARLMLSFSSLFFHLIFVVFIAFFPICSVSVVDTKLWYCSKEKEFLFLGCLLLTSTSKLRRDGYLTNTVQKQSMEWVLNLELKNVSLTAFLNEMTYTVLQNKN